ATSIETADVTGSVATAGAQLTLEPILMHPSLRRLRKQSVPHPSNLGANSNARHADPGATVYYARFPKRFDEEAVNKRPQNDKAPFFRHPSRSDRRSEPSLRLPAQKTRTKKAKSAALRPRGIGQSRDLPSHRSVDPCGASGQQIAVGLD